MADLREMHESLGFTDVSSVLQTGNVAFQAEGKADSLAKKIEAAFEERFGFKSDVMVRTEAELRDIAKRNPFADDEEKAKNWIVVHFLDKPASKSGQESLLKAYEGPEEIVFSGSEIFIYYSQGIGRSKLTSAVLDRHLKGTGTARNWNTVSKLIERFG